VFIINLLKLINSIIVVFAMASQMVTLGDVLADFIELKIT